MLTLRRTRARHALPATLTLLLATTTGCDLEEVAAHFAEDSLGPNYYPIPRVAAFTDEGGVLFSATYDSAFDLPALIATNGEAGNYAPVFRSLHPGMTPVGAATYRGPTLWHNGMDQRENAVWVLHRSGHMIPWYFEKSSLTFSLNSIIRPSELPAAVGSRVFMDIDQAADGTLYVLTHERYEGTGEPASRVFRRSTGGVWTSIWGDEKAAAIAFDQHSLELTLAYDPPSGEPARLRVYNSSLGFRRERQLPEACDIHDIEVLGGFTFLGMSQREGDGCPGTRHLQIRTWGNSVDDDELIEVSALALDVPQLPLNAVDPIDLWRVGFAAPGGYQVQYNIFP